MSYQIYMDVDEGSLARVSERIREKLARVNLGCRGVVDASAPRIVRRAQDLCPTATGEAREGLHSQTISTPGADHAVKIGFARQANGQEVRIERGDFEPHRSVDEHNGCSTGVHGGWDDPYEQVNVFAESGGEYFGNPDAEVRPLGKAIVEELGPVIDLSQADNFSREETNVYRSQGIKGSELETKIKSAVRTALATVILLSAMVCAPFSFAGDGADNIPMLNDTYLAPGDSVTSQAVTIGSKQYFTLFLNLTETPDADGTNFGVYGKVLTAKEKTLAGYQQWKAGEPRWILTESDAITVPGRWSAEVPAPSSGFCWIRLYNAGTDTAYFEGGTGNDENYLWLR